MVRIFLFFYTKESSTLCDIQTNQENRSMGLLIDGKWHKQGYDTKASYGNFIREETKFRHWIHAKENITTQELFLAEKNRYHLFISLACPWAHRTLIFRTLKSLDDIIGITIVEPIMLDDGWQFNTSTDDNPVKNIKSLHQLYSKADPHYNGRVTVPVLWDKKHNTIVNNESSDIIRIFNQAFNAITNNHDDYYPIALRKEIDIINACIYEKVNNGVYRAGFATTQTAY